MAYVSSLDEIQNIANKLRKNTGSFIAKTVAPQVQKYVNSSAPVQGAKMYGQAFQSKPVQTFAQNVVKQVASKPVYNIPNSPTYGQTANVFKNYGVNQVAKPILQGWQQTYKPNATSMDKAMGALQVGQGVFSATPIGATYNTLFGGTAGGLKALRTKGNLQKEIEKGITNPTSIGREGLGIENPWLATGVDIVAGLRMDPTKARGLQQAAIGMNTRSSQRYIEPFFKALDKVKKNPRATNPAWKELISHVERQLDPQELKQFYKATNKNKWLKLVERRFDDEVRGLQAAESSIKLPSKQLPKELEGGAFLSPSGKIVRVGKGEHELVAAELLDRKPAVLLPGKFNKKTGSYDMVPSQPTSAIADIADKGYVRIRGTTPKTYPGENIRKEINIDLSDNNNLTKEQLNGLKNLIEDGKTAIVTNIKSSSGVIQSKTFTGKDAFKQFQDFYNQAKGVTNKNIPRTEGQVAPLVDNSTPLLQPKVSSTGQSSFQPPNNGSQVPPSAGSPSDKSVDPVSKIINAIRQAKPIRGAQEKLYSQERARRFGAAQAVAGKTSGESSYYKQLGQLKGELPKAEFESLRGTLKQTDVDILFNKVKDHPHLTFTDKLTAQQGLAKLLGVKGAGVPNRSELKILDEVYGSEFTKTILDKRPLFQKLWETAGDVLNIPRSLLAGGFDMAYGLRQGILAGWRHPKQWGGAFKEQFKYFFDEKALQGLEAQIKSRPTYKMMRENKLALTDLKSHLSNREEQFFSNLAEKIPGVGKFVRASGRAYTGFANKFRADIFDDMVKQGKMSGAIKDPDYLSSVADFVNTATGRGKLTITGRGTGALEKSMGTLANVFFSPRLMASRFQTINPVYYANLHPQVRKRALESVVAMTSGGMSILALAKLGGAEVGSDPTSSDFGKIKVGNTRIDIWGGYQQPMVLLARMFTGKLTSSVTGKQMELGEGFTTPTRFDIALRFFESKEAPVTSFLTSLMKGKNAIGEDFNVKEEALRRVVPMFIQGMYELYQDGGMESLPLGIPSFFGTGLQTYGYKPTSEDEKSEAETLKSQGMAEKDINSQLLKQKKEQLEYQETPEYKELQQMNKESDAKSREVRQQAIKFHNTLKTLSKEKANLYAKQVKKTNPQLYDALKEEVENDQLGLSLKEKSIRALNVTDGTRVNFIIREMKKLKTKEEKNILYKEWRRKKIISDSIVKQLKKLAKEGKL